MGEQGTRCWWRSTREGRSPLGSRARAATGSRPRLRCSLCPPRLARKLCQHHLTSLVPPRLARDHAGAMACNRWPRSASHRVLREVRVRERRGVQPG